MKFNPLTKLLTWFQPAEEEFPGSFLDLDEIVRKINPKALGRASRTDGGDYSHIQLFRTELTKLLLSRIKQFTPGKIRNFDILNAEFSKIFTKLESLQPSTAPQRLQQLSDQFQREASIISSDAITDLAILGHDEAKSCFVYDEFKEQHQLYRDATPWAIKIYKFNLIPNPIGFCLSHWVYMFSVITVELLANSRFLLHSERTMYDTLAPSFTFAAITFALGFFICGQVLKYKNLTPKEPTAPFRFPSRLLPILGWIATAIACSFALYTICVITSFRTKVSAFGVDPGPEVVIEVLRNPLLWTSDENNRHLFLIAIFCFCAAMAEGYYFTGDVYPGFWRRRKLMLMAQQAKHDKIAEYTRRITTSAMAHIKEHEKWIQQMEKTCAQLNLIIERMERFTFRFKGESLNIHNIYVICTEQFRMAARGRHELREGSFGIHDNTIPDELQLQDDTAGLEQTMAQLRSKWDSIADKVRNARESLTNVENKIAADVRQNVDATVQKATEQLAAYNRRGYPDLPPGMSNYHRSP